MSDRGRAYVEEHSPYSGTAYLVHYMMGDLANDTRDWLLYMGDEKMARKCRTSVKTLQRARRQMIADGFLEVVNATTAPGRAATYRFLMPVRTADNMSTVSEPTVDISNPNGGHLEPERWTSAESVLLLTEEEPKEEPKEDEDEIDRLCAHLQRRIAEYRRDPAKAPAITKAWRTDFDLLLRRGPSGREKHERLSAERVHKAIDFVFDRLAEPTPSRNGRPPFCWASIVRSPASLRAHWDQVYEAGARAMQSRARDPLATEAERSSFAEEMAAAGLPELGGPRLALALGAGRAE